MGTALRRTVKELLRDRNYDRVVDIALGERRLVRAVVSLLYDGEELIQWRAVTMIGRLARAEPEKVRPLVSRFIWWMNDESGGIGWNSAPAVGEIGRQAPGLVRDAARVVIHYRQERILLPGVLWAVGRLAKTYSRETGEVVPELLAFLADEDRTVRGMAAWALGQIGDSRAREGIANLAGDTARIQVYEEEEFVTKEIATISAEALKGAMGGCL